MPQIVAISSAGEVGTIKYTRGARKKSVARRLMTLLNLTDKLTTSMCSAWIDTKNTTWWWINDASTYTYNDIRYLTLHSTDNSGDSGDSRLQSPATGKVNDRGERPQIQMCKTQYQNFMQGRINSWDLRTYHMFFPLHFKHIQQTLTTMHTVSLWHGGVMLKAFGRETSILPAFVIKKLQTDYWLSYYCVMIMGKFNHPV